MLEIAPVSFSAFENEVKYANTRLVWSWMINAFKSLKSSV
ncbi:hypothetical protein JCM19274_1567 [Algibacter lectus]|uniref:Uncharacterized protein n=1 Tax=Algibacter lectus TaxID=221126 RepID=A0A090X0U6_9FLAO|nr:hypothetical protein JCM19274_1567 [Algibacter lectus]